jgi:lipoprotein-anchoring transpeptidase ErfK/SrfK
MNARRSPLRSFAACIVTVAVLFSVTPALAAPTENITADVRFAGRSLQGMDATQAAEAIAASATVPVMAPLKVSAAGIAYTVSATGTVAVDVNAMVAAAFASTEATDLPTSYAVNPSVVTARVNDIAKTLDRKAVDAKRLIVRRRLRVTLQSVGRSLDRPAAIARISAALLNEVRAGGVEQPIVELSVKTLNPRITRTNIGTTIVVSLGERRVFLYKAVRLVKSYRCAIGQPRYPTPTGTFRVIGKSAAPSWHNPGSAWAKSMPAYIAPGSHNPLGLRALYLSASGIRIHGTSNIASIGSPASHGCVRLRNSDVVDIYPRVAVGTPVYIVR